MSSLLTLKTFEETFPQVVVDDAHPNHATLQSFVVAVYVRLISARPSMRDQTRKNCLLTAIQELGCLAGALSNLWVGDRLGRRKTIIMGGIIMIIGAALQTASISYTMLVVARIITGIGNGLNVSLFVL